MEGQRKPIKSFKDLIVYQISYEAAINVIKNILPKLPETEKYDLKDQLSRSAKAVPRLIAEGYAKRHQKMGFQKYLDDSMAESNETMVGLDQCIDLYGSIINISLCKELLSTYDRIGRQLYRLRESWTNFKSNKSNL